MTIIDAINDPQLFAPFLGDLSTWHHWIDALAIVYGLKIDLSHAKAIRQATGRRCCSMPENGFNTALFLCGRRSGKSRIAAVIAAFESVLTGREKLLAPGEIGRVAVVSPTRQQSQIVKNYIRAIFQTELLSAQVVSETANAFELSNGVRIEILTGDHKQIRGYTLLACVIDEAAFFSVGEDSKVKSDSELIRGLAPGLSKNGRMIVISSPYGRRGWCWSTYQKNHSNPAGKILVWNAPSRVMNPTLPQSVVDAALAEDMAAAKSEYLAEFRDDVSEFVTMPLIQSLVIPGRAELLPRRGNRYFGFCDLSGGRSDDAALAIAHKVNGKIIIDLLKRYRPPFDPSAVIGMMVMELKRYGIKAICGDNYAAEFGARGFASRGIRYVRSDKNKSQLYAELLPRLCSAGVELLDDATLITQLSSLERRTRSGGRDVIDHPPGQHDDLSNAVAGVIESCAKPRIHVGAVGGSGWGGFADNPAADRARFAAMIVRPPSEDSPIVSGQFAGISA